MKNIKLSLILLVTACTLYPFTADAMFSRMAARTKAFFKRHAGAAFLSAHTTACASVVAAGIYLQQSKKTHTNTHNGHAQKTTAPSKPAAPKWAVSTDTAATQQFIKHLVSLENMKLCTAAEKGNTLKEYTNSQYELYEYTEKHSANGLTDVTHWNSMHHFGKDAYLHCIKKPGYYPSCFIKSIPTEFYMQEKRQADKKRIAELVEYLSPQTLTVLKHAFAINAVKLETAEGDTNQSQTVTICMQPKALHSEVEAVRTKALNDARASFWCTLGFSPADNIRFDAYSSTPAQRVLTYQHTHQAYPPFTYHVKYLGIHADNIDLFKQVIEDKIAQK